MASRFQPQQTKDVRLPPAEGPGRYLTSRLAKGLLNPAAVSTFSATATFTGAAGCGLSVTGFSRAGAGAGSSA